MLVEMIIKPSTSRLKERGIAREKGVVQPPRGSILRGAKLAAQ